MKEELLNYLKSPVWWATVIFASFGGNLISSYSKDAIDKFVPKLFEWQRIRNAHRQKDVSELAESEANSIEKLTYLRLLQVRHFQNGTLYLVIGCGFLTMALTLRILLGAFPLICAGWLLWKSLYHFKQLNLIDEVIQKSTSKSKTEEKTSAQE